MEKSGHLDFNFTNVQITFSLLLIGGFCLLHIVDQENFAVKIISQSRPTAKI